MVTQAKCIDNRKPQVKIFGELPIGTWFMYDNQLYMKMPPFEVEGSPSEYCSNAIDFNGNDYGFDDCDCIEPIKKLLIDIRE
jgi:hypothetical protein